MGERKTEIKEWNQGQRLTTGNNYNNNKYSISLRHISSNKTIQRRIILYMNIQVTLK